jgi:hypothetical protein
MHAPDAAGLSQVLTLSRQLGYHLQRHPSCLHLQGDLQVIAPMGFGFARVSSKRAISDATLLHAQTPPSCLIRSSSSSSSSSEHGMSLEIVALLALSEPVFVSPEGSDCAERHRQRPCDSCPFSNRGYKLNPSLPWFDIVQNRSMKRMMINDEVSP